MIKLKHWSIKDFPEHVIKQMKEIALMKDMPLKKAVEQACGEYIKKWSK